jgi:hypothetical protein
MKIVTVQTTLQTIFGVLDEDGNIFNKQTVTAEISKLKEEDFTATVNRLIEIKNKLAEQLDAGQIPSVQKIIDQ